MKIAIVGAGPSARLLDATLVDEVWSFNHVAMYYEDVLDLCLDIHHEDAIREPSLGPEVEKYWEWLKEDHSFEIVRKEDYPRETIKKLTIDRPRASSLDWAFALAHYRGVDEVYTFGCTYGSETEYLYQIGGSHYWMGYYEALGMKIIPSEGDSLFHQQKDYGFESWVRIGKKEMEADRDRLIRDSMNLGLDWWQHELYKGAIIMLERLLEMGDSHGRQALERLKSEVWAHIYGQMALFYHGVVEAELEALQDEGRLCVLLHYMRLCDLLPSELEIKRIDLTTKKPFGYNI